MRTIQVHFQHVFSSEDGIHPCHDHMHRYSLVVRRKPRTFQHPPWKLHQISQLFQECISSTHQLCSFLPDMEIPAIFLSHLLQESPNVLTTFSPPNISDCKSCQSLAALHTISEVKLPLSWKQTTSHGKGAEWVLHLKTKLCVRTFPYRPSPDITQEAEASFYKFQSQSGSVFSIVICSSPESIYRYRVSKSRCGHQRQLLLVLAWF